MIRCMKFQVLILENGWVLPFCMPKKATYAIWRLSHFLDFQFSFNLIHSKSVLGSCFHIFDKNLTQKCIATSKLKILRHFPKILTIDNFHVAKGHKRLRGVLRGIPDPIHIVPQLYFNLIRLLCAASRTRTENREFYIWLDLWSGLIVLYHHWCYRYNLQQIWKAWQSEKWTVSPFFWTWNSCSAESLTIKIIYFFCSLSGWYQYLV